MKKASWSGRGARILGAASAIAEATARQPEVRIDAMQRRMDLAPQSPMKLRRRTVEHPFGTIKAWMGHTHFLMKRLGNVKTEINLHILTYNMKRVIRISEPAR